MTSPTVELPALAQPGRLARWYRLVAAPERLPASIALMALAVAAMSLADGLLTLLLLEHHFQEVNPAMRLLLRRGPTTFLVGKYALTVAGLPVLLIFRRRAIFLPWLRVGHVLPLIVAMYVGLLIYQVDMLDRVGVGFSR